ARRALFAGCLNRTLTNREIQEGDQAQCQWRARPQLRRPHRPSRHHDAQYHAHAARQKEALHATVEIDAAPRGGIPAPRLRPETCPVTQKADPPIGESDQALTHLINKNFGLDSLPPKGEGCGGGQPKTPMLVETVFPPGLRLTANQPPLSGE